MFAAHGDNEAGARVRPPHTRPPPSPTHRGDAKGGVNGQAAKPQVNKEAIIQQQPSFPETLIKPIDAPGPRSIHSWLDSIGSSQEEHCQSDIDLSDWDTDDDDLASTSTSDMGRKITAANASYRDKILNPNGIYILRDHETLPDSVSDHIKALKAPRDLAELAARETSDLRYILGTLGEGCAESDVGDFLKAKLYPKKWELEAGLNIAQCLPMMPKLLPEEVPKPKPDLLYGYTRNAFTAAQLSKQEAKEAKATRHGPLFPFLAVDVKAAAGTGGTLWVAANQCAGSSTACLNAIKPLNAGVQRVDNAIYSFAVDNNSAQLYISWVGDDKLTCNVQMVESFDLRDPGHFQRLRKWVENILDWGKNQRLTQIKTALDAAAVVAAADAAAAE